MNEAHEIKLVGESERGARADRLLNDEMLKEAIDFIENDIVEKWKTSPPSLPEAQTILRLKWQCLQDIKGYIKDVAQTGRIANTQLEQERTLKEKLKKVFR